MAISTGSACTTMSIEPSHVIMALGFNEQRAHSSIRIGLGRNNTLEEMNFASERISNYISNLRNIIE